MSRYQCINDATNEENKGFGLLRGKTMYKRSLE